MVIDSLFRAEYFDAWMQKLFDYPLPVDQITTDLIFYTGLGAVAVGTLFLTIARLTRMILRRNGHIILLHARKDELKSLKDAEEKISAEFSG